MINAKEAFLKSQSPEVKERIRRERDARNQEHLKQIEKDIEDAIQRNYTEAHYSRAIPDDLKKILESEGYKVDVSSGMFTKISWNNVYEEPNDILKEVISEEEPKKKKWWQKWQKE
jgi:hypothetical protein